MLSESTQAVRLSLLAAHGTWSVFDPVVSILGGTHRVQRVSATEKNGRRHSSSITVVVLEDDKGVGELNDLINVNDVRVDTYRDSGPGGQHRNKTDSAVRLTHLPSGTVVTAVESKSQYQNREKAWERLREALSAAERQSRAEATNEVRRSEVLSEQRSWSWCSWRDEVKTPTGKKASMKKVLSGKMRGIL